MEKYCPYCYGLICSNAVCVNCNEPNYESEEQISFQMLLLPNY